MKQKRMWTTGVLALSLLGAALPAAATATIWGTPTAVNCAATLGTFSGPAVGSQGSTVYTSCAPPSLGGASLSYSAISDTGLSGTTAILKGAYVGAYTGGLGVTSNAGANSAAVAGGNTATQMETTNANDNVLDNSGNSEMLLLTFKDTFNVATPVVLNALNIMGFSGVDSDLTVLAYGGTGSPNWVNTPYSSLLANGWNLVGNLPNVASNTATPVNPNSRSSSYWLIGAYNSTFGAGPNLDSGNDYVRLLSVTTTPAGPNGVPEPSSLVLAAIALFGLSAVRRRRTA